MKKRIIAVLSVGIFTLGLAIGGIVTVASNLLQEDINLDDYLQSVSVDRGRVYIDNKKETVASVIKNNDGVLDCEVKVDSTNNESFFVDVQVTIKNAETEFLESNILEYVSESFECPKENIIISFKQHTR